LVTFLEPTSPDAEAYRTLRTNLLYSFVDEPPKVIVLTSPGPGEGKSTTCANLGTVLAQVGKRVLVMDCDFRKPAVHRLFGMRNLHGIVDAVAGERDLQKVYQSKMEGLTILPVGSKPPNPSELLSTKSYARFLSQVRQEFDYVLIDTAPIGLVSDAAILANHGDAVLLIFNAQTTRKRAVQQATRSLEAVGANILGTVMNRFKKPKEGYYYNYGYY